MAEKAAAREGQRKGDFLGGKYLLGDCLGIGGMGEVYRATNVSLGRDVAVKILSREYVDNEDDVLRFLREARAAAMIRHPNVVDVLDVARDEDGTPFIVQELLSGEDLERYLGTRGGRLAAVEALAIMIPVAAALGAAHQREVIHRDLKPANIFLAREGSQITPKVLDFGASRYATVGDLSAKELRMLIGTPHYMAPEQIISKTDVDARADVWAIGIILYELLCGETPFEAETTNGVLQLVKTREVPPLSHNVKSVDGELEELVARCTARAKEQRFRDAAAVHDAMREVRDRMTTGSARTRIDTAPEIDQAAIHDALGRSPNRGAPPPVPKKKPPPPPPRPAAAAGPAKSRLLTLSSPTSDPPPSEDDDDLFGLSPVSPLSPSSSEFGELPLDELTAEAARAPTTSTSMSPSPVASRSPPPQFERELDRAFEDEAPSGELQLELGGRTGRGAVQEENTSLPPVLDPRAIDRGVPPPARATASMRPPGAAERAPSVSAVPPRPQVAPADRMRASAPEIAARPAAGAGRSSPPVGSMVMLAGSVLTPAVLAFVGLRVVHLTAPLGQALRGDSMLASGILTVVVLLVAAILAAKSIQGTRDRALFVVTGGAVLFGMAMIVVTFTAGEPPDIADAASVGVAAWVAPIAPLAAAFAALRRARDAWMSAYDRRERVLWAALASVMVLLALELGPLGAARSAPRPPAVPAASH